MRKCRDLDVLKKGGKKKNPLSNGKNLLDGFFSSFTWFRLIPSVTGIRRMISVLEICFTLYDAFSFGHKLTINQAEMYPKIESRGKCFKSNVNASFSRG